MSTSPYLMRMSCRKLMLARGLRPRTPSAPGSLAVARSPCSRSARSWIQTRLELLEQRAVPVDLDRDRLGTGATRCRAPGDGNAGFEQLLRVLAEIGMGLHQLG